MARLYTNTIKAFYKAIDSFIPLLKSLKDDNKNNPDIKDRIEEYIEDYEDIRNKIQEYDLNLDDINWVYDGEPREIDLKLNEKTIEDLSRLTLRFLYLCKNRKEKLENKNHKTEKNEEEIHKLEKIIGPLSLFFNNTSYVLGKHKDKGILTFPGENKDGINKIKAQNANKSIINQGVVIFPEKLIEKLPKDIKKLCNEFNFNYINNQSDSCILVLRRILPLSIVRKFQKLNKEKEIKKEGEYINTKPLVEKVRDELQSKAVYKGIINYKILLDSSQHSFTLNTTMEDAEGAGVKVRVFLEDLFEQTEE